MAIVQHHYIAEEGEVGKEFEEQMKKGRPLLEPGDQSYNTVKVENLKKQHQDIT